MSSLSLRMACLLAVTLLVTDLPGGAAVRTRGKASDNDDDDSNDDDDDSGKTIAEPTHVAETKKKPTSSLLSRANATKAASASKKGDDDSDDQDDDDNAEVNKLKAKEQEQRKELSTVETELDVNQVQQTQAKAKLGDVSDPGAQGASEREIASAVKAIDNETQSPALGETLGKMWTEMRQYAGPFIEEHLEKKLKTLSTEEAKLQAEQKSLRKSLQGTQSKIEKALENGDDADDKDDKDDKEEDDSAEVLKSVAADDAKAKKEGSVEKADEDDEEPAPTDDDADGKAKAEEGRPQKNRMMLGLWFAGVVSLVVVTYAVARMRM